MNTLQDCLERSSLFVRFVLLLLFTNSISIVDSLAQNSCPQTLMVDPSPIADGCYVAKDTVKSASMVPTGGTVVFKAGQCIELQAGFETAANVYFEAGIEGCCDGASITSCLKIIETIQSNGLGIVDLSQTDAVIDYDGCSTNLFTLSFSNTDPSVNSFIVDCTHAAYPGGIVPGGYTVYLWNTVTNSDISSCNNFLQVLDGAGHCV